MRRYRYVGPHDLRRAGGVGGARVRARGDLVPWAAQTVTFVVDVEGILRVADRRSEHVDCAAGDDVLAAGEMSIAMTKEGCVVVDVSNQSTGYCPEPESWSAVANALDAARVPHPGRYTFAAVFRRCRACGERNLVKESWFECAVCGAELPSEWNFDDDDAD